MEYISKAMIHNLFIFLCSCEQQSIGIADEGRSFDAVDDVTTDVRITHTNLHRLWTTTIFRGRLCPRGESQSAFDERVWFGGDGQVGWGGV